MPRLLNRTSKKSPKVSRRSLRDSGCPIQPKTTGCPVTCSTLSCRALMLSSRRLLPLGRRHSCPRQQCQRESCRWSLLRHYWPTRTLGRRIGSDSAPIIERYGCPFASSGPVAADPDGVVPVTHRPTQRPHFQQHQHRRLQHRRRAAQVHR